MADASIHDWLSSIDLQRYERNFSLGGFETVGQCLGMTAGDLKTLDITSSGHVKVLLANLKFLKGLDHRPDPVHPSPPRSGSRPMKIIPERAAQAKETMTTTVESAPSTYSNVVYDSPNGDARSETGPFQEEEEEEEEGEEGELAMYGNVAFDRIPRPPPPPAQVRSHKKRPVPAPRCKSTGGKWSTGDEPSRADENDHDYINSDDGNESHAYGNLSSSLKGRNPPEVSLNRSISLPTRPAPKKSLAPRPQLCISDSMGVVSDQAYANIFLAPVIESNERSQDSKSYENVDFRGPTGSPDVPFGDPREENEYNNLPLLPLDPVEISSSSTMTKSVQLSDADLSYLENLTNEKSVLRTNPLDESSDSLPDRASVPPPSYPPPPLIVSGREVKVPPKRDGDGLPFLPPRPGPARDLRKEEGIDNRREEPTNFSEQYSVPEIPSKPLRVAPSTSKCPLPPVPKSPLLPLPNPPEADKGLYSLETSPKRAPSNPKSSMQSPSLPKKVETFARFEGYLTKQGENRWFVLDREKLSCYANEKQKNPSEIIPLRKIASLSSTSENRCELSFEIFLKATNNACIILTADNLEWKTSWLTKLARLIACVCEEDLKDIKTFDRAGNAYTKSSNHWCLKWFHLFGKFLYVYNEDEKFQLLDLRKAQVIRSTSMANSSKMATEDSPPLILELPESKIYIQGNTKLDTTAWSKCLTAAINKLDPSNLHDHQLTSSDVPVIVDKCVSYIAMNGLEVEGIYRLSGQNSKVTKLLETFNADARGATIKPEEFQIHDVSNCLKRFFRQLRDPLFVRNSYNCWIEALTISDMQRRLASYKVILGGLPKVNQLTIKFIMSHLVEVIREKKTNKMDSINIASIFGPILISDKGEVSMGGYQSTNHEISIIKDFLENHAFLFDINEKEARIERTIREARKRIEQLNKTPVCSSDPEQAIQSQGILVGVTIQRGSEASNRDVVNTQVSPTMTAKDLKGVIVAKLGCGSGDFKDWRFFEVVCQGELERLISPDECVLSILLKYKDWPLEMCTDNTLLFKKTEILHDLRLCLEPKMFLWDDLKFASKKYFKKFYFEFTRCNLSYRKDPKSSIIESWGVEDLVIYMGVQKKRNPPSEFGITFYPVNVPLTGSILGYSVCFKSLIEMYKWLAVLLNSQQQHGLFCDSRPQSLVRASTASESCPNLTGGRAPKMPSLSRPIFDDFDTDFGQEVLPEEASAVPSTLSSSSSSSYSATSASMRFEGPNQHPSPPCISGQAQGPQREVQPDVSGSLMASSSCGNIDGSQGKLSSVSKLFGRLVRKKDRTKDEE